jgi:HPt (histidine-containing phosphotransfer) domain-containing protein
MATEQLIDPEAIDNLRALNPDDGDGFLRDIVGIFLEDTPNRVLELKESLAAGDAVRFTRAAHSIKGSSSNLGATPLRAVAEKLEMESRTKGLSGVNPLMSDLEKVFESTKAELTRLVPPA